MYKNRIIRFENIHYTKLWIFLLMIFMLLGLPEQVSAQSAYEHIQNRSIYEFIDELATQQIIDLNTTVKPYSRAAISAFLLRAATLKDHLSDAQKANLNTWLKEYALEIGEVKSGNFTLYDNDSTFSLHLLPPEISYRDVKFRVLMRPVYGLRYIQNSKSNQYITYGGLEGVAYIGKSWAFYASLRDNYNSVEPISRPNYFTQEPAGNYKFTKGAEFSEMRGGITYSWKWGSIGFIKDHVAWGDNANGSNILSGNTPSFPIISLKIKPVNWLELNYFHGWLVSEVIDSTRSYYTSNGDYRAVFRQKYIAANLYTFMPFKRLNLSVGNAIIYSDVNVQPAYLIPFSFFKSIDHTLNHNIENQNSMMFINFSSRQIRYLHVYFSAFIDEFSISRINDQNRNNFTSLKGGVSTSGFPIKNLSLYAEITRTKPNTFEHYIETTTYASNKYNLGHYLRSNAVDYYFSVNYLLPKSIKIKAAYNYAYHGNDYEYDYNTPIPVDEFPVLKEKTWSRQNLTFHAEIHPVHYLRLFTTVSFDQVKGYDIDGQSAQHYLDKFSPKHLHGNTTSFVLGFNIGF
jgi:hypothetical protein